MCRHWTAVQDLDMVHLRLRCLVNILLRVTSTVLEWSCWSYLVDGNLSISMTSSNIYICISFSITYVGEIWLVDHFYDSFFNAS